MSEVLVVQAMLRRVARRLSAWRALQRLLQVTAGVSAVSYVVLMVSRFALGHDVRGLGFLCVAVLGVGIATLPGLRRVTVAHAARVVDATFGLGERFVTAVECLGRPDGMSALVVRDAARWSFRVDVRRVPRPPVSLAAGAAAIGVATVCLMWPLAGPEPLSAAPTLRAEGQAGAPIIAAEAGPRGTARPARPALAGVRPEAGGGLRRVLGLDAGVAATASDRVASGVPVDPFRAAGYSGSRGPGTGAGQGTASLQGRQESEAGSGGPLVRNPQDAAHIADPLHGSGAPLATPTGSAAVTASGLPVRSGAAIGPAGGAAAPATDAPGLTAGTGSDPGGGGATSVAAARGSRESSDGSAGRRGVSLRGGIAADAVFTRAPVPPALRQYILRYFERLHVSPSGEEPS